MRACACSSCPRAPPYAARGARSPSRAPPQEAVTDWLACAAACLFAMCLANKDRREQEKKKWAKTHRGGSLKNAHKSGLAWRILCILTRLSFEVGTRQPANWRAVRARGWSDEWSVSVHRELPHSSTQHTHAHTHPHSHLCSASLSLSPQASQTSSCICLSARTRTQNRWLVRAPLWRIDRSQRPSSSAPTCPGLSMARCYARCAPQAEPL